MCVREREREREGGGGDALRRSTSLSQTWGTANKKFYEAHAVQINERAFVLDRNSCESSIEPGSRISTKRGV